MSPERSCSPNFVTRALCRPLLGPCCLPSTAEETFEFELEDGSFGNGTDIFIAIQAVDKSNLKSEISNIARVSLFIPTHEHSPSNDPAPIRPDISINSTIPGIHVLKIMWKWLGEMQVTLGLH